MTDEAKTTSPRVYVCTGVNQRFHARVRWHGHRQYDLVGKPTKSLKVALRRLAEAMESPNYKRGDVLMTADYYDPVKLYELVRQ